MTSERKSTIAVIGGSGLYEFDGVEILGEERVSTPFGEPSDVIVRAELHDTELLFLPRHGRGHRFLPTEVNYRANIYALKKLGATWCISVGAVGSLREQLKPGDVCIPEQFIDRTKFRKDTFFGDGVVAHVSFADPFCPELRKVLCSSSKEIAPKHGSRVHEGGIYVCMEGPAFSTRAESHMHRSWNASIIGMTNLTEAKLAREAEIAYGTIAIVTDYDCWRDDGNDVNAVDAIAMLRRNASMAKEIISRAVSQLGSKKPSASAADALQNALFTDLKTIDATARERLQAIIGRYL